MEFGRAFETKFLNQKQNEKRSIEESLDIGWEILRILPVRELDRLSPEMIEKYY